MDDIIARIDIPTISVFIKHESLPLRDGAVKEDVFKTGAFFKRSAVYGFERFMKGHGFEARTAVESVVLSVFYAVGDFYDFQLQAFAECGRGDVFSIRGDNTGFIACENLI